MKIIIIFVSIVFLQCLPYSYGQCYTCNSLTSFACISINQYVPCNGGFLNFQAAATCPINTFCNQATPTVPCNPFTNFQFSCLASALPLPATTTTTASPTTTTTTTTTTTPTTTTSTSTTVMATTPLSSFKASTFCATKAVGNYVHPSYLTGCSHYVRCYYYNNTMTGAAYTCLGTTFFNPTNLICDANYSC